MVLGCLKLRELCNGISRKSGWDETTDNCIQAFTGNCHIVLIWCNHFSRGTEIICSSLKLILSFGTEETKIHVFRCYLQ